MHEVEKKLDQVLERLDLIQKSLNIVPDRSTTITDFDSSISEYENYCKNELKIEYATIKNHKSAIRGVLNHTKGIIDKESVSDYLNQDNKSDSWKSRQHKSIKKYIRDHLKLGNWINDFSFSQSVNVKLQDEMPTERHLYDFCSNLSYEVQIVFLVLYTSGLRLGEVLDLRISNFDVDTYMIDVTKKHEGKTKHSWISYVTDQTAEFLIGFMGSRDYDSDNDDYENQRIFSVSDRKVQQEFKEVSEMMKIKLNPHMLRKVFAERCTSASMQEKYIDAFCGRVPKSVLRKNYSEYSPKKMREQYEKIHDSLVFDGL